MHFARWTQKDTATLVSFWEERSMVWLMRQLGRTRIAIYERAKKLKLRLGRRQGLESVSEAAKRTGFDHRGFMRVLDWARLKTDAPPVPELTRRPKRYVDPFDVDIAVREWMTTETQADAGRRHGVSGNLVKRAVVLAGHYRPGKKERRFRPQEYDQMIAAYLARKHRGRSV